MHKKRVIFIEWIVGNTTPDAKTINTQPQKGEQTALETELHFCASQSKHLTWEKTIAPFPGILPMLSGSFLAGLPISPETSVPPGCSEHP